MDPVTAEDVEAEHALQRVVEKDVHDGTKADVGEANSAAFDRACAKTPVHRTRRFPRP